MSETTTAGEKILLTRRRQGMAQGELAERAGVSQAGISMIEHGKRGMNLDTAVRIAEALDVSLDWLAGRERRNGGAG